MLKRKILEEVNQDMSSSKIDKKRKEAKAGITISIE
jgi:hypothetical protein